MIRVTITIEFSTGTLEFEREFDSKAAMMGFFRDYDELVEAGEFYDYDVDEELYEDETTP